MGSGSSKNTSHTSVSSPTLDFASPTFPAPTKQQHSTSSSQPQLKKPKEPITPSANTDNEEFEDDDALFDSVLNGTSNEKAKDKGRADPTLVVTGSAVKGVDGGGSGKVEGRSGGKEQDSTPTDPPRLPKPSPSQPLPSLQPSSLPPPQQQPQRKTTYQSIHRPPPLGTPSSTTSTIKTTTSRVAPS
ncbi:hypothetical protein HK097_005131, partial [Rhizophlyctis rosea]